MIAEVVLNSSAIELGKIYDYKIPEEYDGTVTIGQRVTVPFGVNNGKKEAVKYENKNAKTLNIIRGVLVGVALILIVVGIFDGGAADVLQKAINICTECIGLG